MIFSTSEVMPVQPQRLPQQPLHKLSFIVKPITILITFVNVLIFMLAQTMIFWYVVSRSIENIIIDKSSIARDIIHNTTILHLKLEEYIKTKEYLTIYNISLENNKIRTEFNVNLTIQWMLYPFMGTAIAILLGLLYTLYVHKVSKNKSLMIDSADIVVLGLVVVSFATEIAIIFILIMRFVYVSDIEIIIFVMSMIKKLNYLDYISTNYTFTPIPTISFQDTIFSYSPTAN